jgi:DNA-binding response OmpR family regulator
VEPTVLILLAEDEPLIGALLQEVLEDAGFAVRSVLSGHQALAAFDEDGAGIAGMVTDIRLGEGPNGWDVARRAREVIPTMPVVYMSGDSANEHSAYGVPDSVMLQKPFATAQLVTAISTLMNAVPPHS